VRGARLQCAYHGWEFDTEGQCCAVPGLVGDVRSRERGVASFAARESQGFVWSTAASTTPGSIRSCFRTGERGTQRHRRARVRVAPRDRGERADVPTPLCTAGSFAMNRARREIEVIVRHLAGGGEHVGIAAQGSSRSSSRRAAAT
jgi:hypothetical protein